MESRPSPSAARTHAHEPERGASTPSHHHVNYMAIFVLLVALTVVTVMVALKRFESEWVNLLLALTIASIKAAFVALFFMHLKFEGKLIYLILAIPIFLCVVLVVALIPDIVYHIPSDGPAPALLSGH